MKKTYLDLSTGHLSSSTMSKLDAYAQTDSLTSLNLGWPAMSLARYRHGYFVTVPPFDLGGVTGQAANMPKDLLTCLFYAFQQGAELVRFDADGYYDSDLLGRQEI